MGIAETLGTALAAISLVLVAAAVLLTVGVSVYRGVRRLGGGWNALPPFGEDGGAEDDASGVEDVEAEESEMKANRAIETSGGVLRRLGQSWVGWWEETDRIREELEAAEREPRQRAPRSATRVETPQNDDLELDLADEPSFALGPAVAPSQPAISAERLDLVGGLRRLLDEQAILVLGPKGSGKSTTANALLSAVISQGHHVAVIDPHAELNSWPDGIEVIGSGLDYGAINGALEALFNEMSLRYQRGQESRRQPLYLFIDEVPSLREECPNWKRYLPKLLREARKVRIHIIVLSQSFLVEDLGLNGDTRTNLTVVALGKAVTRHLTRAPQLSEPEKRAFIEVTRSLDRPAIIDDGSVPAIWSVEGAHRVTASKAPRIWRFTSTGRRDELLDGLLQTSPQARAGRIFESDASLDYPQNEAVYGIVEPQRAVGLAGPLPEDDTSRMIRSLLGQGYSKNKVAALVSPTSKGKGYELIKRAFGEE